MEIDAWIPLYSFGRMLIYGIRDNGGRPRGGEACGLTEVLVEDQRKEIRYPKSGVSLAAVVGEKSRDKDRSTRTTHGRLPPSFLGLRRCSIYVPLHILWLIN